MSDIKAASAQTIVAAISAMAMFNINKFVGFDLMALNLQTEYIMAEFPISPTSKMGTTNRLLKIISGHGFLIQIS